MALEFGTSAFKELGELLANWTPYTEVVKKKRLLPAEKYLQREYGLDCSTRNKYNFEVNKVVYRAIVMMWYRHEIGKLQLEDEKVVLRIKEKIECGLRYEGGEFSKNPSKNMRPEDARIKELANQYLTSLEK